MNGRSRLQADTARLMLFIRKQIENCPIVRIEAPNSTIHAVGMGDGPNAGKPVMLDFGQQMIDGRRPQRRQGLGAIWCDGRCGGLRRRRRGHWHGGR